MPLPSEARERHRAHPQLIKVLLAARRPSGTFSTPPGRAGAYSSVGGVKGRSATPAVLARSPALSRGLRPLRGPLTPQECS